MLKLLMSSFILWDCYKRVFPGPKLIFKEQYFHYSRKKTKKISEYFNSVKILLTFNV
jgi:hypothetical protein